MNADITVTHKITNYLDATKLIKWPIATLINSISGNNLGIENIFSELSLNIF